ncbi:cytochrome c oxidase assembly protein [Bacillus pseudomycoides]|uniref:SCO family protein n=1 Tax=Bacillus pseudomycoides TaxID=64104 RepID=UPI000BF8B008|nr:SCO family protein [Bacillus pseudomycoides]PFW90412.1 cytochrome c oxidase assembly protein [Bacillus pseudomycoides]PFX47765.1 cytochrome c oxidase assembly protein [Bacillus pseudomycoides]
MKKVRTIRLLMIVSMIVFLSACGEPKLKDSLDWKVEKFSYTDQNGKPFGLSDLKGKVWVADFIFTSCETVCPPMTANMTKLKNMLKEEGINDVEFVSFSVDPTVDKPEKLKEFMERYDTDVSKWHFLTNYTQEEITSFAKNSFQAFVDKPASTTQVIHGTKLYLVDKNGIVVKSYSALTNTPYKEIIQNIKTIR